MVIWECPEHQTCAIVSEPGEMEDFSFEVVEQNFAIRKIIQNAKMFLIIGMRPSTHTTQEQT